MLSRLRLRLRRDQLSPATSPALRVTILAALADAEAYRRALIDQPCADCDAATPDPCGQHWEDLQAARDYAYAAELLAAWWQAGGDQE